MINITDTLSINEEEIEFQFIRSPGPGGQNVNKVSSAVQIRFDVKACDAIAGDFLSRLKRMAGQKMTNDGVIVITASTTRSQVRNRELATERLVALLKRASVVPKKRKATKPSASAVKKRLEEKKKRGTLKKSRTRQVDHQ